MTATQNGSDLRQLYDERATTERDRKAAVDDVNRIVAEAKAAGKYPIVATEDEQSKGWYDRYTKRVQDANAYKQHLAFLNDQIEGATLDRQAQIDAMPAITGDDRSRAHGGAVDPTRGFQSMAHFGLEIAARAGAQVDRRLFGAAPTDFSQLSGDDSGAGFMAPPAFEQQIQDLVDGVEMDVDVLNLVNPLPTSANQTQLLVDETTVWSGNGIIANWRAEGAQMSPTKLITKARSLVNWEAYVFVLATQELLDDVAGLNARLTDESAEAFRWLASEAIVNGDGVGKPVGLFSAGSPYVSVAKETSQAAATIVAANVLKMYARLIDYRGAFWIANRTTLPQLYTMSLSNINTGTVALYTPPAGSPMLNGGILLGLPVLLTEHCQVLGTKGDLILVGPNGYAARKRTPGPNFASSMHLYFDYNIQAFRWTFRFGGMPLLSAAVTPAHGSTTLSHFVTLDDRS